MQSTTDATTARATRRRVVCRAPVERAAVRGVLVIDSSSTMCDTTGRAPAAEPSATAVSAALPRIDACAVHIVTTSQSRPRPSRMPLLKPAGAGYPVGTLLEVHCTTTDAHVLCTTYAFAERSP